VFHFFIASEDSGTGYLALWSKVNVVFSEFICVIWANSCSANCKA